LEIEQASFRDPWPLGAFVSELEYPWSWFKVIGFPETVDTLKRAEGYIICWMLKRDLHILNLAVDPDYRRRGLVRFLVVRALIDFARKGGGLVSLEVRPSNSAAQHLYGSIGFQIVGRRPGYYRRDNEDALIMSRKVDRESDHLDNKAFSLSGNGNSPP